MYMMSSAGACALERQWCALESACVLRLSADAAHLATLVHKCTRACQSALKRIGKD